MDMTVFLKNFSLQFDETDPSEIKPETIFRDLDEWSSLIALSLIAMVDEEYNAKLTGNEIKVAQTVQDIFDLVKSKI
jgi:acyl carrier protein